MSACSTLTSHEEHQEVHDMVVLSRLKRSSGSGRLDCAKKHKDALTPGSRIRDLPDCSEKLEGSRLGMPSNRRGSNFVDKFKNSEPSMI